ncbi:hypothetical protein FB451DRAFT_1568507 [Mycena latifolia]|nr:hypothetical protein FB451DRAFT_1568507 [Mycena latifolia]
MLFARTATCRILRLQFRASSSTLSSPFLPVLSALLIRIGGRGVPRGSMVFAWATDFESEYFILSPWTASASPRPPVLACYASLLQYQCGGMLPFRPVRVSVLLPLSVPPSAPGTPASLPFLSSSHRPPFPSPPLSMPDTGIHPQRF